MNIEKIDRNFASNSYLPDDITFHDCREEPFQGYGLYRFRGSDVLRRMPQNTADLVSPGVSMLCRHTAGGRIRFRTNSRYLAIRALLADCSWMGHMPFVGSCGFAVYLVRNGRQEYYKSVIPAAVAEAGERNRLEGVIDFWGTEMKEVLIYLPLYSGVTDLWLGLQKTAAIEPASGYRYAKPVLYYGSSITQGGCASRPGNSYEGFISRELDCDYINLGFSGNGKGEVPMAEYLASLDVSVFVLDYDHNAPSEEYLEQTHERFFKIYRKERPATPVIMVSRPDFNPTDGGGCARRREAVRRTYQNALERGDRNVYFIDGETLFQGYGLSDHDCTVDGCHPNDLGFWRMAEKIGAAVRECLREI